MWASLRLFISIDLLIKSYNLTNNDLTISLWNQTKTYHYNVGLDKDNEARRNSDSCWAHAGPLPATGLMPLIRSNSFPNHLEQTHVRVGKWAICEAKCFFGPTPTADGAGWNTYLFLALIHCHLVNFIFSPTLLWPSGERVVSDVNKQEEIAERETSDETGWGSLHTTASSVVNKIINDESKIDSHLPRPLP